MYRIYKYIYIYKICILYKAKGIAEARGGARGPENVWGSAATVRKNRIYYIILYNHFII